MQSVAQQAKEIAQSLRGIFTALTASSIGSDDYKDKALVVHKNVLSLAQMHPHWSEESKRILNWHKEDVRPLEDNDPFILVYEYMEALVISWRDMNVAKPTINSLATGNTDFIENLNKLHTECDDLTNRKRNRANRESVAAEAEAEAEALLVTMGQPDPETADASSSSET